MLVTTAREEVERCSSATVKEDERLSTVAIGEEEDSCFANCRRRGGA